MCGYLQIRIIMFLGKNIITLGIFCFVTLLLLAGLVVWNGQSREIGKIVAVEDRDISRDKADVISLESVVEDDEKTISAESFLAVLVKKGGTKEILIEKNKDTTLPMASISKLLTALVAVEQYRADEVVTMSEDAMKGKGVSTVYHAGDRFYFSGLFQALLVGSHNEVANLLAEKVGTDGFVGLMNQKARKIGLTKTSFVNVTGLDTATSSVRINSSTATDVVELVRYIEMNQPQILSITGQRGFDLFDVNKKLIAKIVNTNILIGRDDLPFVVIGGKTGETPRAKQSLVVLAQTPCGEKIFSVVLGSKDRFGDMQKILRYVKGQIKSDCQI
jgi:D-alanyl-D-alanine carboxypeptidase